MAPAATVRYWRKLFALAFPLRFMVHTTATKKQIWSESPPAMKVEAVKLA